MQTLRVVSLGRRALPSLCRSRQSARRLRIPFRQKFPRGLRARGGKLAPGGGPHRPVAGSCRPAGDLDSKTSGTRSAPAQAKDRGLSYPIVGTARDARARRLRSAVPRVAGWPGIPPGGARVGWIVHWGLNRDPFVERGGPYVPVPGHEEAVARLVHTIEAGHRLAVLSAPAGMGKTLVLGRALAEARDPCRRFAMTSNPMEGGHLYSRLAEKLGSRGLGSANRGAAWIALEQAVRGCAVQGFQVVLAVDDCASLIAAGAGDDLRRLEQIGASAGGRVTVLLVWGEESHEGGLSFPSWTLAVGLRSLSCSETETYLTAKLAAAGCREAIFSQRAVTRLHVHSRGSPGGLDCLASLCLMAGAYRGLEAISSDVVEGVLGECHQPTEHALRG